MNKIISLLTFTAISSVVLFCAGFTLKLSIKDNPNPVLFAHLLKSSSAIAFGQSNSRSAVLGSTSNHVETDNTFTPTSNCPPEIVYAATGSRSVVNYLHQLQIDYSFSHRTALASQYGITDYRGTAEQNVRLMSILFTQNQPCPVSN